MNLLITGATGLIGQEIVTKCHQEGYIVHYLTTSKSKIKNLPNYKGFFWNPKNGEIDTACLNGVEVIINLAGATISKRWTKSYKKVILQSRISSLDLLAKTLRENSHTVRQLVSASAIGIYPDSKTKYYTEASSNRSSSFLGMVVKEWELAAYQFAALQIDVVKIRIGLVIAKKGGAFPEMAKPIKLGVGATFGSGDQWQSWIHVEDVARIFVHAVKEELTGVYNAVAPNPISNKTLTHLIADAYDKKIILPGIPKFVMKLILGDMHILLYDSQRVSGQKIQRTGFEFKFDNCKRAIAAVV